MWNDLKPTLSTHCEFDSQDAAFPFLPYLFLLYLLETTALPLLTGPMSTSLQHETDHPTTTLPSHLQNPASLPLIHSLKLFTCARSLRRGWLSMLAEGKEAHVPVVQALLCANDTKQLSLSPEQFDGGMNVLRQELSVDRAERWDQDKWEAAMRTWLQSSRTIAWYVPPYPSPLSI